jgi:hypothetical protein
MQDTGCPQPFRVHRLRTRQVFPPSRASALVLVLVLIAVLTCGAQSPNTAASSGGDDKAVLQQLQSEIHELKTMVVQLQQETVSSRAEITRLREELADERSNSAANGAVDEQSPAYAQAAPLQQRVDQLEENQQLLSSELDTQYQTKVESASKYRVRLSGIVLFNLFGNSGSVDNQDVPTWAMEPAAGSPSGSVGGTLRQSIIGLEAFGPDLWGARTSANVNFDFGGGFPSVYNGVDSGLVRLRTAAVRLDWQNTSVIGGQDELFISPLSPTSFASVIVPALSYAGNLWAWTPQLRVEHRFVLSNDAKVTLQGGILDPVTGELPADNYTYYRTPTAGEGSRQPAFATRVAYSHAMLGQTFTIGAAGYYSRQNWGFDNIVNGWAGIMDANLPLSHQFSLSGSFYRGAAIGGLGGALGRSVISDGPLYTYDTEVNPVNTVGGWAQLKYRATPKLEFNAAFGDDNPFAADIRYFGEQASSYAPAYLTANRSAFGNVIFRPRSDLLFAAEYRRLRTFTIYDSSYEAGQVNLSMGVLF